MKKINERTMSAREKLIPELAEYAVKNARSRTLQSGRSVVEAVDGKLVVTKPDGSREVLKSLAASITVVPGQKIIRKTK